MAIAIVVAAALLFWHYLLPSIATVFVAGTVAMAIGSGRIGNDALAKMRFRTRNSGYLKRMH
jgi:hypothetical protein